MWEAPHLVALLQGDCKRCCKLGMLVALAAAKVTGVCTRTAPTWVPEEVFGGEAAGQHIHHAHRHQPACE